MKNIPVKFRAKDCITDDFVFGDLIHDFKHTFIGSLIADGYAKSEVYPDSVSQLVGYDAAGNEVYEGDWIKLEGNTTDVVQVRWDNNHTCVAVSWNNGLSDSYGTVFNHYDRKPFLVEVDNNE